MRRRSPSTVRTRTAYGSGQFGGNSWNWERYYIGWLEQNGYDVAYSTNLDTHTSGARLLDFKGFLSVGHDEYWSKAMLDNVTTARDAGVNLGFFGSNTAYWQVRFEQSAAGVADRVMVCYKNAAQDPVKDQTATVLWRDPPANRPEQTLVGIQYTAHLQNDGKGAMYVVQNSSHWVWNGTGFTNGTQVPGILGYETDRLMSEYPSPAGTDYAILSGSPVVDAAGRIDIRQHLYLPGTKRRLGLRQRHQPLELRAWQAGSDRCPHPAGDREHPRPLPRDDAAGDAAGGAVGVGGGCCVGVSGGSVVGGQRFG